jgi:hypothetical protein
MKLITAILSLVLVVSVGHAVIAQGLGEVPGQWWSGAPAGKWGGILGGSIGSLAGILGGLTGWLAPKGKGRKFILGSYRVFQVVGIILLAAGITAVIDRQPYHVYYPLLLPGFLLTILVSSLLPVVRRTYAESEMRKMDSQDARGR